MNHGSKLLVEANNYGKKYGGKAGSETDILHHFYDDGVKSLTKRREQVEKVEKKREDAEGHTTWSCVRCGYFHSLTSRQLDDILNGKNPTHKLKCSNCDYERDNAIAPFAPINIGFGADQPEGAGDEDESIRQRKMAHVEQLLYRRTLAKQREGGDLFNSLYSNDAADQGQLTRQRREWETMDNLMPFKPQINANSRKIVHALEQEHVEGVDAAAATATATATAGTNTTGDGGKDPAANKSVPGHHLHPTYEATFDLPEEQEKIKADSAKNAIHGRSGWVTQHIVNNFKANKSAGTHYHHDSKGTSVGDISLIMF